MTDEMTVFNGHPFPGQYPLNPNLILNAQMYFEAGYKAVVLFEGWNIETVGAMVGSCIGVFLMAILYEGLKYFR